MSEAGDAADRYMQMPMEVPEVLTGVQVPVVQSACLVQVTYWLSTYLPASIVPVHACAVAQRVLLKPLVFRKPVQFGSATVGPAVRQHTLPMGHSSGAEHAQIGSPIGQAFAFAAHTDAPASAEGDKQQTCEPTVQ